MVQTVPLDGGQLQFVLLDDFLQSRVQVLLLLLQELLLLNETRLNLSCLFRNTNPLRPGMWFQVNPGLRTDQGD